MSDFNTIPRHILAWQFIVAEGDEAKTKNAPSKSHPDDAGVDICISRDTQLHGGQFGLLPTNIRTAIPAGYFGLLTGRSSLLHKKGIMVYPGIIDPGYRGEIQATAINVTNRRMTLFEGERVLQLVIIPTPSIAVIAVQKLPESGTRGEKGFGSTGGYGEDKFRAHDLEKK